MSAYLVTPSNIGTLAQAIAEHTADYGDATAVAQTLAKENLRSVAYRYRTSEDGAAHDFMAMSALHYCRDARCAALYAGYHPANFSEDELMDMVGEYRYQSCECDDWPETVAAQALSVVAAYAKMARAA